MDQVQAAASPVKGHINVNDTHEVNYWTEKLDVTKVRLKAAVNAVGPVARDVEAYLKKNSK